MATVTDVNCPDDSHNDNDDQDNEYNYYPDEVHRVRKYMGDHGNDD